MQKKIQVVTKPNCSRCKILKDWLKEKDYEFTEWLVENQNIQNKLLHDKQFTNTFCDIEGCKVFTPLLRVDETGKYYSKQLFGIDGLREEFLSNLILKSD